MLAGNLTSGDPALAAAVRGQDAVISALGVGKSFKSCALIEESMSHLVRAMEGEGVRRLIFTSAFGVGDTYRDVPLVPRIFIRSPMPFRTPSPYERTISMLLRLIPKVFYADITVGLDLFVRCLGFQVLHTQARSNESHGARKSLPSSIQQRSALCFGSGSASQRAA